ncbi:amidohydrolase [Evansella clarkii]|jgi:imidazolonepropionase-like amidohydrolase|uniref:amidohydrolase n=1 Tax=Evansella clarkii TaxID=79879 RepID=UPI000997EA38|nr:amidohydrolase [Evansella clarkii]
MKAYVHGTVLDGLGETYENGTVLVDDGKVVAAGQHIDVPSDAEVIDCSGYFVTPGLIDVHTHLGVYESGLGIEGHDANETSEPVTPYTRAIDGINPTEKGFEYARASGVTTAQVMPGSINVMGGQMVVLKTVGNIVDEMIERFPSGMKIAYGENPKQEYRDRNQPPNSRMGIVALVRQALMGAQDYLKLKEAGQVLERNLHMEHLLPVIKKEIPLRAHAHRADDIMTAIRVAKEFDVDLTIEHCTEGHFIAEHLAEAGINVAVGPTLTTRSKVELSNKGHHTLPILEEHGVPFSLTTDHPIIGIDYLTTTAGAAVKCGLSEESALKAITSQAARHIGMDHKVGSLEKGKDADIVLWTGHPFHSYTSVVETIVNGKTVYLNINAPEVRGNDATL